MVVLEFTVVPRSRVHQIQLLQLLHGLRQGLVVEPQAPKHALHALVLLELLQDFGDEVHRQLRDEGDFLFLFELDSAFEVEFFFEEGVGDFFFHF